MRILISTSDDLNVIEFKPVGAYGINGSYSTVFVASPLTALAFVKHLQSLGIKRIYTGKRGKEFLIGWDGKFVDVAEWKRTRK